MQKSMMCVFGLMAATIFSGCFSAGDSAHVTEETAQNLCDIFENGERAEVVPTVDHENAPDVSKEGVRFDVKLGGSPIDESRYLTFFKQEENTLLVYATNRMIDLNAEHEEDGSSTSGELNPSTYDCNVVVSDVIAFGAGQVWLGTYAGPQSEFVREDYSLVVAEVSRDAVNDWENLHCRHSEYDAEPACVDYWD